MSHDGWLEISSGGPEPIEVAEIGNYTRNVSPMWRKALAYAKGEPFALQDTDYWLAGDAAPLLATAAQHMADHPDEYERLNPPNGWGNYSGAMEFLRRAATLCSEHPNATVRWSW